MNQNIERDSTHGPQLFGQPRGLATLFMTEMWERFTYYGMRAILILFMAGAITEGGLGLDDKTAGAVYGLYIAATYLLAPMGGWIADRLIGQQRSVIWGGVLIMLGNGLLAAGDTRTVLYRADRDRARRRPAQAEHQRPGRAAVPGRRLAARRGLLDLLHGHQSRRGPRLVLRADHRGGVRLERRLRVARARYADRPGAVPGHEKSSRHFRPGAARQAGHVVADRRLHGRGGSGHGARDHGRARAQPGAHLDRRELDDDRARRRLLQLPGFLRWPRPERAQARGRDDRAVRGVRDVLGGLRADRCFAQPVRGPSYRSRDLRLGNARRRAAGRESRVHHHLRAGDSRRSG